MDNLLGQLIGGYQIVSEIGSGGLATVYKAYQAELKRWVAIKILYYRDPNTRLRFELGARAMAQLHHRNLLTIYDYGEQDGYPFLVMEYVEQGTLRDQLKGQPMEWQPVIKLILPLTQVLDYIHQHGKIHGDVKPANILMPQANWPLLADFGLMKLPQTGQTADLNSQGAPLGTPAYISPEQARNLELDYHADMYALGVVMFEMLAGRLPFNYANASKILLAHISESIPPLQELNPDCPSNLTEIITKMLAKSPEERYISLGEVGKMLKDILAIEIANQSGGWAGLLKQTRVVNQKDIPTLALDPRPNDKKLARQTHLILPDKTRLDLPIKNYIIIGRTHRQVMADIDLMAYGAVDMGVSRHHAALTKQPDGWYIDDLGSLNGTFVNNVPVMKGYPILLKNGDVVRLSTLSVVFYDG